MEKYDVIIFMGQSNMQGQSGSITETDVVDNAFEYKFLSDELVPLKTPVGENIGYDLKETFAYDEKRDGEWRKVTALGTPVDNCTSLVPNFCRKYIAVTSRKVVAVHAAKGATVISEWTPDAKIFAVLSAKIKACLTKLGEKAGDIYGVWLQGESDAIASTDTETYAKKLTAIKDELKRKFGLKKFGVIKVGNFTFDERDERIFNAQENLCKNDGDFVMLTRVTAKLLAADGYTYVHGHYNAKGQEIIGNIAGYNLGAFITGKPFVADEF